MNRRGFFALLLGLPFLRRWKPATELPLPPDYRYIPAESVWWAKDLPFKLYITKSPAYTFGFSGFNEADRQRFCPEVSMEQIERDIVETGQHPRAERQG